MPNSLRIQEHIAAHAAHLGRHVVDDNEIAPMPNSVCDLSAPVFA
jgi:hypothetical protein